MNKPIRIAALCLLACLLSTGCVSKKLYNELAARLPAAYVRLACDFGKLFGCADKTVRRLLTTQGIEIVREDRIVVL